MKPLVGTTKDGKPYCRPPNVEEEIKAVLERPLLRSFGLAAQGKLLPQTIVYLLRNFKPNRPTPEYDSLVVTFLSRLKRTGEPLVRGMSELNRERVHERVMDKALGLMAKDDLDIFEMSFKRGAERLYLTAIAYVRLRAKTEVSREDLIDPDSGMTGEEAADTLGFVADGSMPLVEARASLREIFKVLNDKERLAVFYVLYLKHTEKEAGEKIGCTDRAIRYLLERASEKALNLSTGRVQRTRKKG